MPPSEIFKTWMLSNGLWFGMGGGITLIFVIILGLLYADRAYRLNIERKKKRRKARYDKWRLEKWLESEEGKRISENIHYLLENYGS